MKTIFGVVEDNKIYTDRGGRMICLNCYSMSGVRTRNYRAKNVNGEQYSKLSITCLSCNSNEKHNNWTGEILEQNVKIEFADKYKDEFMNTHKSKVQS